MAELTQVKAMSKELGNGEGTDTTRQIKIPANVEIFSIRGAFFFAAVHKLMEVNRILAKAPKALVLDMADVLHIDASGLHVLDQIHKECRTRQIRFVLSGLHSQPYVILDQANRIKAFGAENIKGDLKAAIADLKTA